MPGFGWLEIVVLGCYAVWIGEKLLDLGKVALTRRRIWFFFSVVFFTQLFLGLLGMNRMLMTGKLHLPIPALIIAGPLFRGEGIFMPVLFLFTVLIAGPAWCSHLCYIGAWDNLASLNSVNVDKLKKARILELFKVLKPAIFLLVILFPLILKLLRTTLVTATVFAIVFGITGAGIMLLFSRKMGVMVHCTYYCPIALLSTLVGKVAPWRIRIGGRCTICGKCTAVCRYNALEIQALQALKSGNTCTLCGDCLSSCSHQQIYYSLYGKTGIGTTANKVRTAFIILITVLHTLFLAVARI
ncbi:MAG: 4Fe-4S binding protein [Spirochaetota bacterium]